MLPRLKRIRQRGKRPIEGQGGVIRVTAKSKGLSEATASMESGKLPHHPRPLFRSLSAGVIARQAVENRVLPFPEIGLEFVGAVSCGRCAV